MREWYLGADPQVDKVPSVRKISDSNIATPMYEIVYKHKYSFHPVFQRLPLDLARPLEEIAFILGVNLLS